jgi:hypothetical protein
MTINDTLSKIDKIFEDYGVTPLASVPTEPVASGMMSAVTGKLGGLGNIDSRYKKFDNVTDNDLLNTAGKDFKKFENNANKLKPQVPNLQSAESALPDELKKKRVSDKAAAIAVKVSKSPETEIAAKVAKDIIDKVLKIAVDTRLKNDIDKCKMLISWMPEIATHWGINLQQVKDIARMIWEDESEFSGYIEKSAGYWNKQANTVPPGGRA